MNRTFDQARHAPVIGSAGNHVMLSALQSVHRALRTKGISLPAHAAFPPEVETLVKHAHEQGVAMFNQRFPSEAITPQSINLRLEAIEQLHHLIDRSASPLVDILPRHRWRMCVDPKVIDAIEQHISDARENPMLCFAFDKEPGYLGGVLEGLAVSMEHLGTPLSADFLADLHEICCEQHTFETSTRFSSGFELELGNNMTDAGRHEVLGFMQELRRELPAYGLFDNEQQFASFRRAFEQRASGTPLPVPAEPTGDTLLLKHAFVTHGRLLMKADDYIKAYEQAMSARPDQNEDQKLEHIVGLCQKLERLHRTVPR